MLFEVGLCALADGYPGAAISEFKTSLERFCVLCIKIFRFSELLHLSNNTKTISELYEQADAQPIPEGYGAQRTIFMRYFKAERQYLDQLPLPPPSSKPRNQARHDGYIPNKKEAQEYGEKIYNFIRQILRHFYDPQHPHDHYRKGIEAARQVSYDKTRRAAADNGIVDIRVGQNIPTMIDNIGLGVDFHEALRLSQGIRRPSIAQKLMWEAIVAGRK